MKKNEKRKFECVFAVAIAIAIYSVQCTVWFLPIINGQFIMHKAYVVDP